MKKKGLNLCRLYIKFMRYSEMIDLIDRLFCDNPDELIIKFKIDLLDLESIKVSLKDCLNECERQIGFLEQFLDDCGVNVYDK